MKYARQAKLLDIIENSIVETQEELAERLKECGMDVTQATISRDIKELKIIKTTIEDGRSRYICINQSESFMSEKLMSVFANAYVSSDYSNNIVVVKTLAGMAQAAASVIDSLMLNEIIGSIAGDDTIMIVCRVEKMAENLVTKFNKIIKQ